MLFRSEDEAIELTDEESTEGFFDAEDKAIELTDEESMELMANIRPMGSPESPEPVELSAEDEVLEEAQPLAVDDETVALTDEELVEPMELSEVPEPLEDAGLEPETELADDDIMDQMIRGVEELKESVQPFESDSGKDEDFSFVDPESDELESCAAEEPEIFAEVRPRKMDDMDDLDSAFKELSMGGRLSPTDQEEKRPELSSLGGIVPEPEDLLEQMAPGAFSEVGKISSTPEDIKENLDYIAGFSDQDNARDLDPRKLRSRDWSYDSEDELFTQAIAEEVKHLVKRSLGASLEKEVYGLSDAILKTIREVVIEVVPDITRKVIREEIEKIKKQDMY